MQKSLLLIIALSIFSKFGLAQKIDTSLNQQLDSAAVLKELMDLMDVIKSPTSYFSAEAGVGNRLFSVHNNRLNARQSSISTLVFTPSVGYFHHSGLSLTAGAYLLNDKTKGFGASQYALTPAFDLLNNKAIGFSVSYTHTFVKDYFSVYASPVQNDFYTAFSYKKPWLKPGIAAGYSTGIYRQLFEKDTTIGLIRRRLYDSATSHLQSFSMMVSVGHDFEWDKIFKKGDGLLFTPSFIINFGSYKIDVDHKTNAPLLLNRLIKRGRLPKLVTSEFRPESVGLNLDLGYSVGNFSFSPKLYLDYYLPESDTDKFTSTFNFSVSYIF